MAELVIASLGFVVGPIGFASVTRWVALWFDAFDPAQAPSGNVNRRRAITLAICRSPFHAGPWAIAGFSFFAYQVRDESWAPWFFGGFAVGFLLMTALMAKFFVSMRAAKKSNP